VPVRSNVSEAFSSFIERNGISIDLQFPVFEVRSGPRFDSSSTRLVAAIWSGDGTGGQGDTGAGDGTGGQGDTGGNATGAVESRLGKRAIATAVNDWPDFRWRDGGVR
jgi:hypothetical protein